MSQDSSGKVQYSTGLMDSQITCLSLISTIVHCRSTRSSMAALSWHAPYNPLGPETISSPHPCTRQQSAVRKAAAPRKDAARFASHHRTGSPSPGTQTASSRRARASFRRSCENSPVNRQYEIGSAGVGVLPLPRWGPVTLHRLAF